MNQPSGFAPYTGHGDLSSEPLSGGASPQVKPRRRQPCVRMWMSLDALLAVPTPRQGPKLLPPVTLSCALLQLSVLRAVPCHPFICHHGRAGYQTRFDSGHGDNWDVTIGIRTERLCYGRQLRVGRCRMPVHRPRSVSRRPAGIVKEGQPIVRCLILVAGLVQLCSRCWQVLPLDSVRRWLPRLPPGFGP